MHNRLTHSEKVAQVGRSIAEALIANKDYWEFIYDLGGIDADVVEAAGLAHDLGHAPFGHIGERTLDQISRELQKNDGLELSDGFEGNAQTLRIVLMGETRDPRYDGLDLTCATLAAIAKYPWRRATTLNDKDHKIKLRSDPSYRRHWRKFSVYESEANSFDSARAFLSNPNASFPDETQSLEASIMDVADDITYAIHDFEDFYIAGILDIHAILEELGDKNGELRDLRSRLGLDYPGYYDDGMFDNARTLLEGRLRLGFSTKSYRNDADGRISRARAVGSELIGRYIQSVTVTGEPAWGDQKSGLGPFVTLNQERWHEVQILKELTRSHVIQRPDIALLQRGQQMLLRELVKHLHEWKQSDDDFKRLPYRLRSEIEIARGQERGDPLPKGYYGVDPAEHPLAPRGDENRCILDYLCTLTDGQTYALYNKLTGAKVVTAMDFFS